MLAQLRRKIKIHPRAWLHSVLTYPRFLGRIKPQLMASGEDEVRARLESFRHAWECKTLQVPVGRRLVVVSPHPDDETIGAGGLLLAHRGKAQIDVVTVFNGEGGGRLESGPWRNDPAYKSELVAERKSELGRVAGRLGANTHALDLPDGYSSPNLSDARRLGDLIRSLNPDVVLLPWYLDALSDHRMANILYAWGCADLDCVVLGFEVWSLLTPNAIFQIGDLLQAKLELVKYYRTQLATVDYLQYAQGIAFTRAFVQGGGALRNIPAEAFLALPNADYCELVRKMYGEPERLTESARRIFGLPEESAAPAKKAS